MKTQILTPNDMQIELAAAEIKGGGLVAFPTETVYGLGADALNPEAVKKIFEVKGRPGDNPLIVHLPDIDSIEKVAYMTDKAKIAAQKFMPGALTIVLKKRKNVPGVVSGGLDTVAVRIPSNPVALRLLKVCGTPLAAPSANTSTRPSPTLASHVKSDLDGKIRYILDGGGCDIGLESTILDFSGDKIRLLRHGGIAVERLSEVLGEIEIYKPVGDKPLSPGMKYRHYAPNANVILFDSGDYIGLKQEYLKSKAEDISTRVLMLECGAESKLQGIDKEDIIVFKSAEEYANKLFLLFRLAEAQGVEKIICMLAPDSGLGKSLNNRLIKAGGGNNER